MKFILIEENEFRLLSESIIQLLDKIAIHTKALSGRTHEEWLDTDDICLLLGISKRSIQYYRSIGVLPYSMIGNKVYFKAETIQELLQAGIIKTKQ